MNQSDTTWLNSFKENLEQLGALPEPTWTAFAEKLYEQSYEKGEIISEIAQIERKIYFILEGAVRVYALRYNKKQVSTNFRFSNQFASSITSFITNTPSQYTIIALVPTRVVIVDRDHLYWMYEHYLDFNRLGRRVMEYLLVEKRQRELDILTLTAEERYLKMLQETPNYIQLIPLKHLASFLGVTAESLSRIRANL